MSQQVRRAVAEAAADVGDERHPGRDASKSVPAVPVAAVAGDSEQWAALHPSPLDMMDRQSMVHSSRSWGWITLLHVTVLFLVAANNVESWNEHGRLAGLQELAELFSPNLLLITVLLVSGASLALPLALASNRRLLSRQAAVLLLSCFVAVYLSLAGRFVWEAAELPASQRVFVLSLAAVLWMKAHSFVMTHAESAVPLRWCTASSWAYFVCAPTLVYREEYGRTARVRWGYVAQKIGLASLLFAGLHVLSVFYITPVMRLARTVPLVVFVARLLLPMIGFYLLLFFLVFECILNLSAELLRFAERRFYDDWWNSTTFSEFARKWNKPVHDWLALHIYFDARRRNMSRTTALLLTFFFSAVFHDMVLMLLVKSWKPFLFPFQMSQVVLIVLGGRLKGTQLGNFVFHFGIGVGIPLLSCLYAREYALYRSASFPRQ